MPASGSVSSKGSWQTSVLFFPEQRLVQLQAKRRPRQAAPIPAPEEEEEEPLSLEEEEPSTPEEEAPATATEEEEAPAPGTANEDEEAPAPAGATATEEEDAPAPATATATATEEDEAPATATEEEEAPATEEDEATATATEEEQEKQQTLKAVKRKLPFGTLGKKSKLQKKSAAAKEEEEEEKDGGGGGTRDVSASRVFMSLLKGKSRGSTLRNIKFGTSMATLLRAAGLAPTTLVLYVGQAISFMEYFRDTPAKYSRVTNGQLVMVTRELRKLMKDLNRNVLGHQSLVKQGKQLRLVAKEDLAKCQLLAKEKAERV
ncbi:translation initiation factor IF-2-like [Gadus chalcogrammus]|uniref:translation initiation factor IF-2-like n=1 Tax=Gadus chalcogrammus TaxID=1042646 RepID=UPI0024C379BE|nr:translation initiation factor IF-2-like [Gadus chalcogrammus]